MPETLVSSPASRLRRLRVDVGTIITFGVLGQAALLLGLGYWGAQRIVGSLAASVHSADHQRVDDKIRAFLDKGVAVARTVAATPQLEPSGPASKASAAVLWALLAETPELDSIYVADSSARMLMVLRYPEPAVRFIARANGITHERWEYKLPEKLGSDARARFVTQRTAERETQYNPLERAWFRAAEDSDEPVWTAPYVFNAARELGVTYAIGQHRITPEGDRTLVVATDVTLGRLSDFVRQFSHAGYGDSALLSAKGEVLARSDARGVPEQLARPQDGVLGALASAQAPEASAFPLRFEGQTYLVQRSIVPSTGWTLLSWVPENRVLGGVRNAVVWGLLTALVFLALMLYFSLRLARGITRPVEKLASNARRIGQLDVQELPRVSSRLEEIRHLDQALADSAHGLRAFMKFVPVDVVRQLMARGQALTASVEPRELTVMFTDVRGFTHIAETVPAQQLVAQMTRYFNTASTVIAQHGGTLDKFVGDALMVLWGAPQDLADAPLQACRAALDLQRAFDELNAEWACHGLPAFETCIGIHTGPVVAGVLGADDRLTYTALGDTVNVASRIEDLNRELGTRILISDTTRAAMGPALATRAIGAVPLRGRQTPLEVWELLEQPAGPSAGAAPPVGPAATAIPPPPALKKHALAP